MNVINVFIVSVVSDAISTRDNIIPFVIVWLSSIPNLSCNFLVIFVAGYNHFSGPFLPNLKALGLLCCQLFINNFCSFMWQCYVGNVFFLTKQWSRNGQIIYLDITSLNWLYWCFKLKMSKLFLKKNKGPKTKFLAVCVNFPIPTCLFNEMHNKFHLIIPFSALKNIKWGN